jgi:hypothetical protein
MKRLFFYFLFVFLGVVFETEKIDASLIRAPSVFGHHEADLHKYSAVLAATEPFRLQCQSQLKQSLNPIKYWSRKLFGELFAVNCKKSISSSLQENLLLTKGLKIEARILQLIWHYHNLRNELRLLLSKKRHFSIDFISFLNRPISFLSVRTVALV